MRPSRFLTIGVTVVTVLIACTGVGSAAVKIQEIVFDPPFGGVNREMIVITNSSTRRVSINGWSIRDAAGHVYEFSADIWIGPQREITLHTGRGPDFRHHIHWGRRHEVWDDDGDVAILRRAHGERADRCAYSTPATISVDCG